MPAQQRCEAIQVTVAVPALAPERLPGTTAQGREPSTQWSCDWAAMFLDVCAARACGCCSAEIPASPARFHRGAHLRIRVRYRLCRDPRFSRDARKSALTLVLRL